jgi:UDP-N-acetylmuramoyl-L-alanyl-D-glutamate--2,6-diaminopimelate ligase
MEASSHGLAQSRLNGAMVEAGGFTNLTRDHLDYHPDAEAYAAAKLTLFAEVVRAGGAAVINCDDPLYPTAASICASRGILVIPVGRNAGDSGIRLLAQDPNLGGQRLRISWRGESRIISLPLAGAFQAWNALIAAGLAIATGGHPESVFAALEHLKGAPGRMQLVARRANGAGIFVDYAHSPDAIRTAIAAIRPHTPGRVHVLFGAGGDRDPGKRPLMAEAAAEADVITVTDDNPRREDPAAIRAAVMAGLVDAARATEIGGRAEAILRAVDALLPGDTLIVAGKGHETGQVFADRIDPFDDREQARAAVIALDGEDCQIIEN